MGGLHVESRRKRTEVQEMPGPGAYKVAQPTRKGGTISQHVVKTEMDFALERAAEQPGPGEYELTSLASGKSSTMTGRTRGAADIMLSQAARRPGPDAYGRVVPRSRVRGGAMTQEPRSFGPSLPAIAPGPGSYHQTPTIDQERQLRALSKQVLQATRRQAAVSSLSAPARGSTLRNEPKWAPISQDELFTLPDV